MHACMPTCCLRAHHDFKVVKTIGFFAFFGQALDITYAKIDTTRDEGEETLEKCKRDPMYL